MNDNKSFDRFVAEAFDREGPGRPVPDAIHDELISHAGRKRQWPTWLASIKEPPMRLSNSVAVGSPTVRAAAVMAATLLLALLLAAAGIAGTRLLAADDAIVVDQAGGGDFTTIAEAVAVAEDGDTILVKPGIYPESVTITRSIELRGEDPTTSIIEAGAGCLWNEDAEVYDCEPGVPLYDGFWWEPGPYGLLLDGTDARIHDLGFRFATDNSGIVVVGGAPLIEGVIYETDEPFNNLFVRGGSAATIRGNDLAVANVFVEEQSPAIVEDNTFGYIMANTGNASVAGGPVTIRNNRTRQIIFHGEGVVEGNEVVLELGSEDDVDPAVSVEGGDGWVIRGNTITGSGYPGGAIAIGRLAGPGTVIGNTLVGNDVGITARGSDRVEGNTISDGLAGIVVTGGSPELIDNTIEDMANFGITMATSSPTLSGNRACGSSADLRVPANASPEIDDSNEFCVVEDLRED